MLLNFLIALVYLSFFLVQFDIRPGGTPQDISYFSGDNCALQVSPASAHLVAPESGSKSGHVHFRLNKRFHPEKYFIAFLPRQAVQGPATPARQMAILPQKPLLWNPVQSLSRRGPPELV